MMLKVGLVNGRERLIHVLRPALIPDRHADASKHASSIHAHASEDLPREAYSSSKSSSPCTNSGGRSIMRFPLAALQNSPGPMRKIRLMIVFCSLVRFF